MSKVISYAWLAALIEGEGTICISRDGKRLRPLLDIKMSDEDVVQRAAEIMGASVYGPYVGSKRATYKHAKPLYRTRLRDEPARRIMRAIRPQMGVRRQAQIDKVLGT